MENVVQEDLKAKVLKIKEKGPENVASEDIPVAFEIITQYITTTHKAQNLLEGASISFKIELKNIGTFYILYKDGKAQYEKGDLSSPTVYLKTDLVSIAKILLGEMDAIVAFFSDILEARGDLYYLIIFAQILELAFDDLGILSPEERTSILPIEEVRELIGIYTGRIGVEDVSIVPKFLHILTEFINHNPEAQDEIEGEELHLQLTITGHADYTIYVVENHMRWEEGASKDAQVTIEAPLDKCANIIIEGDAVSAYLAGELNVKGALQDGLFFQELIEIFQENIDIEYYE